MALFNDGPINRTDELLAFDSSVLDTAALEGVDTTAQIANAQEAIGTEILTFLLDNGPTDAVFGDTLHNRRRRLGMSDVVVTPELKRWHAFQALHWVYRDAYGRQSNDRYEWKYQEYGKLAQAAKTKYLAVGIGLAVDAIPRAAAPQVTTTVGGGNPMTLYFAAALVNAAGQEGAASEAVEANPGAGTQAKVALSGAPANARGWNVYAGSAPGSLMRQNGDVLQVDASWTQPGVIVAGDAPGAGQRPSFYAVQNRIIRRG